MQSKMPPIAAEASQRPEAGLTAEQEQQRFAEAMQAAAKAQAELDVEEEQLVDEARSLGIAWHTIAEMLSMRPLVELQQRHNVRSAAQAQQRLEASMTQQQWPAPGHAGDGATDSSSPWFHIPRRPKEAVRPRKLVGDERIKLLRPRSTPPEGFTGLAWHKRHDTTGWKFFNAADVVDPDQDDGGEVFHFDLSDEAHGACFNLGEDAEGNTLISWSALHALYTLLDGSIWAEHSDFIDRSDMEELAKKQGTDVSASLEGADEEHELFRRPGRRHSKLQDVEYQCWVFRDALPRHLPEDITSASDAFFWRKSFDPKTLQPLEE